MDPTADNESYNNDTSHEGTFVWQDWFGRGTTNIQWCEDVLAKYSHHASIAEFWNTISNLAFCLVALVGLQRYLYYRKVLSWHFAVAELIIGAGVGVGSMLFHGHQSRVAQISDELPMSVLLVLQIHCLENLHPYTTFQGGKWPTLILLNHAFVVAYWLIYTYTNVYEVFLHGFTVQVLILLVLSFDTSRRRNHSQQKWFLSIGCLIAAKAVWDLERHRYTNNNCTAAGTIWLHPLWHLGSAMSHYFSMSNHADLNLQDNQPNHGKVE